MRFWLRICLASLLCAVALADGTVITYENTVTVIGKRERDLNVAPLTFAVDYTGPANAKTMEIALRVREVIHEKTAINRSAFAAKLVRTADGWDLVVTPHSTEAAAAGTYTVTVEIPKVEKTAPALNPQQAAQAPASSPREPVTPNKPSLSEKKDAEKKAAAPSPPPNLQFETVTLTRRYAETSMVSPLRVDRIVGFPCATRVSSEPKTWILSELSDKAGFTPNPSTFKAAILGKSGSDLGKVVVTFPPTERGAQADATLAFEGNKAWVGDGTATVRLRGNLQKVATYVINVKSRLSYWWLTVAIGLGVLFGLILRKWLDGRAAKIAAKMAAEAVRQSIIESEGRIGDLKVRDQIRTLRGQLETLMNSATPEETLTSEAKRIGEAVEELVKTTREAIKAAGQKLQSLSTVLFGHNEQPPPLPDVLQRQFEALDAQRELLAAGHLHKPAAQLDTIERELLGAVTDTLVRWKSDVRSAVRKFGEWPTLAIEKALEDIDQNLASMPEAPKNAAELETALSTSLKISRLLRNDVGRNGMSDIHDLMKWVREELVQAGALPADASEISRLRETENELRDLPTEKVLSEAGKFSETAKHARLVMTDALRKANAGSEPEGLATGDFELALRKTLETRNVKPEQNTPAPPPDRDVRTKGSAAPASAPSGFGMEIPLLAPGREMPTSEEYQRQLSLTNTLRDAGYGTLILFFGYVMFQPTFIGTLEDFAAALIWGFSVDLTAATLTTYAAPVKARLPFRATL